MTSEGVLPPVPALRQLKRASPSTYLGFRRFKEGNGCALSLLWAGAAPLPQSPAALVGQVAHEVLDSAMKVSGVADSVAWAESKWSELESGLEANLRSGWLERGLLPLRATARGYAMKRLATIQMASKIASEAKVKGEGLGADVVSEESIISKDGSIGGRIDLAFKTPSGWILKDYKSGAVTEDDEEGGLRLKPEYAFQMHLYAILFQDRMGELPASIFLVPLIGPEEEVAVDAERCTVLRKQVRETIEEIQRIADSGSQSALAMPLPADHKQHYGGCSFCRFRPFCAPYRDAQKPENGSKMWPRDVWGRVTTFKRLPDGCRYLEVENENTRTDMDGKRVDAPKFMITLQGDESRHPALLHIAEDGRIGIYNYLKSKSDPCAIDGPMTTVYILPVR